MENEIIFNGLYVRIDWLEFTVTEYDREIGLVDSVYSIIDSLGIPCDLMDITGRGGIGYKNSVKHLYENIQVFFQGTDEMGIHVRVSGSAIKYALQCFLDNYKCDSPFGKCYEIDDVSMPYVLSQYMLKVLSFGHFTRIDVAIDDLGVNYFSVDEIYKYFDDELVSSKFKVWDSNKGSTLDGKLRGFTVYAGSRESDVFLRIYDKMLEQEINLPWVRWEFEIKHAKADVFAKQVIDNNNIGELAFGLLNEYMRIIIPTSTRKTRCKTLPKWDDFIGNVKKTKLSVSPTAKSYEKKIKWFKKQCLPTLSGIIYAKGGDISFLGDSLELSFERLTAKDRILFEKAKEKECAIDDI